MRLNTTRGMERSCCNRYSNIMVIVFLESQSGLVQKLTIKPFLTFLSKRTLDSSRILRARKIDVALLYALRESGATCCPSGELAAQLDIDHRDVSRRIYAMNKRMEQETREKIIAKHGH